MTRATLNVLKSAQFLIPFLLLLCATAIFLRRKQKDSIIRQTEQSKRTNTFITILTVIILVAYLFGYTYLTIIYRRPRKRFRIELTPLWSYKAAFQLHPIRISNKSLARQILLNILLTVPAGLFLPMLYHRAKHPYLLTFLTILLLSVTTETLQYFTKRGLCETDDVINNLLGGLLGLSISAAGSKRFHIPIKTKETGPETKETGTAGI